MKTTLSVLIPTKDRFKDVQTCVESILSQTVFPETLIVIDASEKKGLKEILEKQLKKSPIKLIYLTSEIKSITVQRNLGIKANKNDLLLFLDDDVILENGFIEEVKSIFASDKNKAIGSITGKVINRKRLNYISNIVRRIFCLSQNGKGEVKKSMACNNYLNLTETKEVQWAQGCCSTFRKELFNIELYDSKLTGYSYMEDLDLSYRISKISKIIFCFEAKCTHNHYSYPTTRMKKKEKRRLYIINYYYFFRKNSEQRIDHKLCHYWSYIGLVLISIFFHRDINHLIGTLQGIMINVSGRNHLVKELSAEQN